jgi:competence protein ComEC
MLGSISLMRTLLSLLLAASFPALAAKTLDIYFIDTEGGQSTLMVSPSGQAFLIDTGYTNFSGRDADRIAAAAKMEHVKRIEVVLITHHHADHEGGVPNLLERFQVGTFYDHGPTVEPSPDRTYKAYEDAMAKQHRERVKPGDAIAIKGLDITVVAAGGAHIDRKGDPNPYCAGLAPRDNETGENPQSSGVVVQFGKFRFADFGDLTWNKELELLCPDNRVGKVDLYLTSHHGGETSKSIWALAPRVAIMNNGARKGGDPKGWKTVRDSPGLEDLWQLHFAVAGGKESNAPDTFIANVVEHCGGQYLKVSASSDGSFTVFNPRNKYTKAYPAK